MKVKVNVNGLHTSAGKFHKGDEVELTKAEIDAIFAVNPDAIEKPKTKAKSVVSKALGKAKKTRARNADGTLKGDDPSTPDVNEAWVNGQD